MNKFTIRCACGRLTSKVYARNHGGKCKSCAEPEPNHESAEHRNARLIDSGYEAYAREEGHYDIPDSY